MCDIRCMSKEFITEFIELYRQHPTLWKIKSREYSNRNLKNSAYNELVEFYKRFDPNANRDVVTKKIQSLRGSFRKELRKVKMSKRRSGKSGTGEIYTSNLWYYDLLAFTTDQEDGCDNIEEMAYMESDGNINGIEETEITCKEISEVDNDQKNSFSTTNIRKKTTKRKHQKQQEQYSFIQACTEALREKPESNSDDEYEALGKYIAKKLKRLKNRDQRILAESLLTQVLHKAALSKLTENTIIIESNSVNT